jgi:hypothetical protein
MPLPFLAPFAQSPCVAKPRLTPRRTPGRRRRGAQHAGAHLIGVAVSEGDGPRLHLDARAECHCPHLVLLASLSRIRVRHLRGRRRRGCRLIPRPARYQPNAGSRRRSASAPEASIAPPSEQPTHSPTTTNFRRNTTRLPKASSQLVARARPAHQALAGSRKNRNLPANRACAHFERGTGPSRHCGVCRHVPSTQPRSSSCPQARPLRTLLAGRLNPPK